MTQAGEDRKFHLDEAPGITGSRSLGEGERKLRDPGASALPARPGSLDDTCSRNLLTTPADDAGGRDQRQHAEPVIGGAEFASRHRGYPRQVSALIWWLFPISATVIAVLWATFRSRPEKPTEANKGMANLRRLADAMERPMPQEPGQPRRRNLDNRDTERDTAKGNE